MSPGFVRLEVSGRSWLTVQTTAQNPGLGVLVPSTLPFLDPLQEPLEALPIPAPPQGKVRSRGTMPEGTMPQSLLVFFAVIFGMCCTVGLAVVIPLVANVILAVVSAVFGEMFAAKLRGQLSGTLTPEERPGGPPKVVIGYPPGYVPPARQGGEVKVEPDDVPITLITRLAGAVTVVVVVLVAAAINLFDMEVASQLQSKGYPEATTVIPRTETK